jgi:Rad3-related DNA helicase
LEKRDNQIAMTKEVFDTFVNSRKVVIEAPTGI